MGPGPYFERRKMGEEKWRYESEHTILRASPDLRERFREGVRAKLKEEHGEGYAPSEEEVEEMAAFAWHVRAKDVCAKADVLIEEGVPGEEVMRILRVEPE
jgi:hypothetical protein